MRGKVKDHRMLNYCCSCMTRSNARFRSAIGPMIFIGKSVNDFGKGSRSIKDTEKDSPICPYYHGNYIQRALRSFTGQDNAAAIDDV